MAAQVLEYLKGRKSYLARAKHLGPQMNSRQRRILREIGDVPLYHFVRHIVRSPRGTCLLPIRLYKLVTP